MTITATTHDGTAYATCATCLDTVPVGDIEGSPSGCGVDPMCGDCMAEHGRACGACAAEIIGAGDL